MDLILRSCRRGRTGRFGPWRPAGGPAGRDRPRPRLATSAVTPPSVRYDRPPDQDLRLYIPGR